MELFTIQILAFNSRSLLWARLEEKEPNVIIGKLGSKSYCSKVKDKGL
jgi:hypothetical protein